MIDTSTPVLIVGGGPTGLTASCLLSKLGIANVLIEKRRGTQPAPAAHVINRRTMEIFRQAGMDMDAIYALNRHGDHPLAIRWKGRLNGPTLAELVLEPPHQADAPSPEKTANISQPLLEAHLIEEARRHSSASLHFGHEWLGFVDGDKTRSRVRAPDGSEIIITSTYTLAADGAGSPVRRALGIGKTGPDSVATFLNLSCEVDRSSSVADTNELLTWCLEPKFSGVVVTHDPERLTVVMRQVHEPYESIDDYDEATCLAMLKELFGEDTPFTLLTRDPWRMTAQVADRFRRENVFLIGDAAHRFPPTGGLGLNSGVADAHNLCWKIGATLSGAADDLLDTYETERMPVVQRNCDASLENFHRMDEVISAIGLDARKAALPARILGAPAFRSLPRKVRAWLFGLLTAPARAVLTRVAAQTPFGEQRRRAAQIAALRQMPHFDMPELELGYSYPAGLAVAEGAGERFPHADVSGNGRSSPLRHFSYEAYTLLAGDTQEAPLSCNTFGLPVEHVHDPALSLAPGDWVLVRPDGHVADRLKAGR